MVNAVGPYTGKRVVGLTDYRPIHYTTLAVTARGAWTMSVYDVSGARQEYSSVSGTGDDVVMLTSSGSVATLSHHGQGYFSVWARSANGRLDLIANDVGEYWGTRVLTTPALLQITADGSWQIDTR